METHLVTELPEDFHPTDAQWFPRGGAQGKDCKYYQVNNYDTCPTPQVELENCPQVVARVSAPEMTFSL
jgi:hypothetical protein